MPKPNTLPISMTCVRGINQSLEGFSPQECLDARNVWAPKGKVEKRPGVLGLGYLGSDDVDFDPGLADVVVASDDGSSTPVAGANVSGLAVGGRIYVGFSTVVDTANYPFGLYLQMAATNSNDLGFFAEYWNGTEWTYVPGFAVGEDMELDAAQGVVLFGQANPLLQFVWPGDLAQTTIAGSTRYFFRFTLTAINGSTALDASTQFDTSVVNYVQPEPDQTFLGLVSYNGQLFFSVNRDAQFDIQTVLSRQLDVATATNSHTNISSLNTLGGSPEPLFATSVPETREWFIIAEGKILYIDVAENLEIPAAISSLTPPVEDRDFAVGDNAPYDRDFVAQRAEFPAAKYILYHGNRLWMADASKIMWGAPYPYHRVLPLLSEEPVGPGEEGEVTGLAAMGEHTYVFKQRALYRMVFQGLNAFNLAVFRPIKVADVGTVSNASIKTIRGELVFLSENGLMAFNGQTVRKVSLVRKGNDYEDRLLDFFSTLPPGKWQFAAAADWKANSVYLLSVAVDGSDVPNQTLVWDYDNDTFWIWEGFEAQHWVEDSDGRLYFADTRGRVFEMGNGNTDHGAAIESYILSSRIGLEAPGDMHALRLSVTGENLNQDVTVSVLHDDNVTPLTSGTGTLAFDDYHEASWDDVLGGDDTANFTELRRVKERLDVRVAGSSFQVKLAHSTKNVPFAFTRITLEPMPVGE